MALEAPGKRSPEKEAPPAAKAVAPPVTDSESESEFAAGDAPDSDAEVPSRTRSGSPDPSKPCKFGPKCTK